ncbi:MAG: hypothetical protein JXP34_22790 [Planctomycetes bacterium]|nr:hypothetical protein [Planctomycetota bacterium]
MSQEEFTADDEPESYERTRRRERSAPDGGSGSSEKLSRLEAWFARNQEKALALIEKHLDDGEEVVYYATGWRYPPDILTWIPFIGTIIDSTKKRYLLAATRAKLVVIRMRRFRFEEISSEIIPMGEIRDSAVNRFPLFCNLRVELAGGKTLVFKEMIYEWAAGLKDAIDEAQGRASTVD